MMTQRDVREHSGLWISVKFGKGADGVCKKSREGGQGLCSDPSW